ncbi:ATP-binding cassette domain-containing protein [Arthrobacter sp. JZ12]|uniref:ABC transporter ATP-binding protein n=1 Tax=Arthrobacter sp. JZ12 TaxID=2654190 RepID=UPI002B460E9E|nr:ABC transporter ATP-binding protein [Arthrobacter sp. JZ12]WRH25379.1 ATP-binding cassette domain-containing protein [Arthrobacter sp. JZ12]
MKNLIKILRPLLATLPAGSRRFLLAYGIATACLAVLDMVALGAIALILPALVTGDAVVLPLLGDVSATVLPVLAGVCLLILLKGVLAVVLLRMATARFAQHEVLIGNRLFAAYLASPWSERLKKNSSDLVRMVDVGVGMTVAGVLIPAMTLFGEFGTLLAIIVVLFLAEPIIAVVTLLYLGLVAFLLSRVISPKAVQAGRDNRQWSSKTVMMLTEAMSALKELTLAGRAPDVQERVNLTRTHSSRARARSIFLNQVPRYVLETALVVGFALVGSVGLITGGTAGAVSAVGLFAVAGFRLVPSLTRLQAVQSQANSSASFANNVIKDIRDSDALLAARERDRPQQRLSPGRIDIELLDVSYAYPNAEVRALDCVNITIPAGSHVAFVGSSGAGKSTLIDLLLGLLEPSSGHIKVGGTSMDLVLDDWRKRIGYVPQEVSLFDATVGQNVALTWNPSKVDPNKVRAALRRAQLLETIENRPGGIDAMVAERGLSLSGGQRQRLGIARALYDNPNVLVMDEATSALDTTTEAAVTTAIRELHGEVTVITVAHRLSTIRNADIVFFMKDGRVEAHGSFNEVVAQVPDFARQAALAGLS